MREFFGIGGYTRTPEGYFSLEHVVFVTSLMIIMVVLAVVLGKINKNKSDKEKNRVLMWAAVLIDLVEIIKIVVLSIRGNNAFHFVYELPLFLCSIQLITIPLAAFSKGRVKEAAMDFVLIFGLLGAVLGTYGAGQNYASYPVLSIDNVASGITHCISGFSAIYIAVTKLATLKKSNIWISFTILGSFCILAYVANVLIPYNYMFLMRGDGTPYDIFYNMVNGSKIWYPLIVVALFLLYITLFYAVYYFVHNKKKANK